jgi:hypothetical protein
MNVPLPTAPVPGEAALKGVAARAILEFVKARKDEATANSLLDRLSPELRAPFGKMILPTSFYPMSSFLALQHAGITAVGGDKRDQLRQLGRFASENALTGVYRIFLKVGSPEFIISKASRMFGNYFQNLPDETFRVLGSTSKSAHIAMDRFTGGHPDFCRRLDGYFERLVELSGGKNVRLAHILCAFNTSPPGDHCEWKGYWE